MGRGEKSILPLLSCFCTPQNSQSIVHTYWEHVAAAIGLEPHQHTEANSSAYSKKTFFPNPNVNLIGKKITKKCDTPAQQAFQHKFMQIGLLVNCAQNLLIMQ
jgi:hypothetical protein